MGIDAPAGANRSTRDSRGRASPDGRWATRAALRRANAVVRLLLRRVLLGSSRRRRPCSASFVGSADAGSEEARHEMTKEGGETRRYIVRLARREVYTPRAPREVEPAESTTIPFLMHQPTRHRCVAFRICVFARQFRAFRGDTWRQPSHSARRCRRRGLRRRRPVGIVRKVRRDSSANATSRSASRSTSAAEATRAPSDFSRCRSSRGSRRPRLARSRQRSAADADEAT